MRITTKDGKIVPNRQMLREIHLDDRARTATAIGEDGRKFDLFYDNYQRWEAAFDPVIPGSGVLLIAYRNPEALEEPNTRGDLRFAEYKIIGWRITGDGGARPVTAASEWEGGIVLSAIQEVDRWADLGEDGLTGIGYLDRTDFEYSALASARIRWRSRRAWQDWQDGSAGQQA